MATTPKPKPTVVSGVSAKRTEQLDATLKAAVKKRAAQTAAPKPATTKAAAVVKAVAAKPKPTLTAKPNRVKNPEAYKQWATEERARRKAARPQQEKEKMKAKNEREAYDAWVSRHKY